jgi:hypothetical protein
MSVKLEYGAEPKYTPWWEDGDKFFADRKSKAQLPDVSDWEDTLDYEEDTRARIRRHIRRALRVPAHSLVKSAIDIIDEQLFTIAETEYVYAKIQLVLDYVDDLIQVRTHTITFAKENIVFMPEPVVRDRVPMIRAAPTSQVIPLRNVLHNARIALHTPDNVRFYWVSKFTDSMKPVRIQYLYYLIRRAHPTYRTYQHRIDDINMSFPYIPDTNALYILHEDWDYDAQVSTTIQNYIDENHPYVTPVHIYYPGAVLHGNVLYTHVTVPHAFTKKLPGSVKRKRIKDAWRYLNPCDRSS